MPIPGSRHERRGYEYRVVTQRDGLWSGRFDAAALTAVLNQLGRQGWRLAEIAANSIPGLLTSHREEMMLVFERELAD